MLSGIADPRVGIFASKGLSIDDVIGVPHMGMFEVYDDVNADVRSVMSADGLP